MDAIEAVYSAETSKNWSPDHEINLLYLRHIQNYMNDRLRMHGLVFLNEVFLELGMPKTRQGQLVGWCWNQNSGDDFIDFGIWGEESKPDEKGAIVLKFNVDGEVLDKLD